MKIKYEKTVVEEIEISDLVDKCMWQLKWDYKGWKKTSLETNNQIDWNQTLITKINQISAQIQKSTLMAATRIFVHINKKNLLETLVYYHPSEEDDNGSIAGRYIVNFHQNNEYEDKLLF